MKNNDNFNKFFNNSNSYKYNLNWKENLVNNAFGLSNFNRNENTESQIFIPTVNKILNANVQRSINSMEKFISEDSLKNFHKFEPTYEAISKTKQLSSESSIPNFIEKMNEKYITSNIGINSHSNDSPTVSSNLSFQEKQTQIKSTLKKI
ncbi:MAG: hypothetical protein ISN64_02985 [Rickettsia sp.]|nr:hypothetical protein [Rickettsia sp.]